MHEIITLQFGQQANYLGTHYWNTQESYFTYEHDGQDESPADHDISFRPDIGADGQDTYTPRTLIYDLKGAFGTLRRENALYELRRQEQSGSDVNDGWGGAITSLRLPPVTPSSYQQALEQGVDLPRLTTETVRFWSDYNHLFYHPRSIVQLNEYEVQSQLMPFERWSTGEELFLNLDREHDLLDRDLRPWLEECDQLQGLQMMTGWEDAWGGFAAKYLERIGDELGKGCRWVYGLSAPGRGVRERRFKSEGAAMSMVSFTGSASMILPIEGCPKALPGYVQMDQGSRWHTSALQAVLVESLSLPTRLRMAEAGRATFDVMETTLCNDGKRRITSAGLSVDESLSEEADGRRVNGHADERMANGHTNGYRYEDERGLEKLDSDFFPESTIASEAANRPRRSARNHIFSAVTNLRGHWESSSSILEANIASHDRFATSGTDPRISTYQSQLLFPGLSSFPRIFRFASRPEKLAVKARMETSTGVARKIRELEEVARRLVGVEEREALCDALGAMAEGYEEGWSDDEEEGFDDG